MSHAAQEPGSPPVSGTPTPDARTMTAFVIASMIAGANAVAVRVGLAELAPFWGASIRFLAAAAILIVVGMLLRRTFPRGRALLGAVLYGTLSFGLTYAFLYWALQEATAGTVMIAFAVAPLLTLMLAVTQRLERFSYRGFLGALVAGLGIAIVFADQLGAVSALTLAAILAGAVAAAQSTIVVKSFPKVDPLLENGIGMAVGGVLLLAVSATVGEPWVPPVTLPVQLSLVYLVFVGSIGLFLLFLYILSRWTASATIYVLLLAPLAAVALDLLVLGDAPTPLLVAGGLIAIAGVYVGTLMRPRADAAAKGSA